MWSIINIPFTGRQTAEMWQQRATSPCYCICPYLSPLFPITSTSRLKTSFPNLSLAMHPWRCGQMLTSSAIELSDQTTTTDLYTQLRHRFYLWWRCWFSTSSRTTDQSPLRRLDLTHCCCCCSTCFHCTNVFVIVPWLARTTKSSPCVSAFRTVSDFLLFRFILLFYALLEMISATVYR